MVKLPFVVQPRLQPIIERIGTEESGQIEIERRGYLTTGEKAFVQQVQQFDNGSSEIITLTRQIARRYGLSMDKAYTLVVSIVSGASVEDKDRPELIGEIEKEFAESFTEIVKGIASSQVREDLVMAACLIKYRIDKDFDISNISEVHPDIIEGLARLYVDEEQKSVEAFSKKDDEGVKQSIEEIEKKQPKTQGSRSRSTTGS